MTGPRREHGGQGSRNTAKNSNVQVAVWSNILDSLNKDTKTVKYTKKGAWIVFIFLSCEHFLKPSFSG